MKCEVVKEFPDRLFYAEEGPFISLYQPTHRTSPDNRQDPIMFKNLLKEIEESLEGGFSKKDIERFMQPFRDIKDDKAFWNNTLDGLAVLANPERCIIYKLSMPVKEFQVVADSIHIKPLVRYFQTDDKYQVLGLSLDRFELYEGNRYGFTKLEIPEGDPITLEEVLGSEQTDAYLSYGSYNGASGNPMFHGHGDSKAEKEIDTERFFRYVDKYVYDNYSKPSGFPLILVAVTEHHGEFRKISRNPNLAEKGIKESPKALAKDEMQDEVWKIMEPLYVASTQKDIDVFNSHVGKGLASDDINETALAAIEGRVDKLIIERDKIVPGRLDRKTAQIATGKLDDPGIDDVIDDIAEIVIKNKGRVVVLPKERMPSETGIAAIYRY